MNPEFFIDSSDRESLQSHQSFKYKDLLEEERPINYEIDLSNIKRKSKWR